MGWAIQLVVAQVKDRQRREVTDLGWDRPLSWLPRSGKSTPRVCRFGRYGASQLVVEQVKPRQRREVADLGRDGTAQLVVAPGQGRNAVRLPISGGMGCSVGCKPDKLCHRGEVEFRAGSGASC